MNLPNLTIEQRKAIKLASKQEIEDWMDEIYPGIAQDQELNRLYHLLNQQRSKKDA